MLSPLPLEVAICLDFKVVECMLSYDVDYLKFICDTECCFKCLSSFSLLA